MAQSGSTKTQHESFVDSAGSREFVETQSDSPHLSILSGRANLTPDEYLILFGDSPDEAAKPSKQESQTAAQSLAWQRIAKLAAHPYLSATVLVISVLVGAALARGLMG